MLNVPATDTNMMPTAHIVAATMWYIFGFSLRTIHPINGTNTQYADERKWLFPGISSITPIVCVKYAQNKHTPMKIPALI